MKSIPVKALWLVAATLLLASAGAGGYLMLTGTQTEEERVKATVRDFMLARLSRDDDKVRTFLSRRYHQEYVTRHAGELTGGADPHYHRYHILAVTPLPDGAWTVRVKIEEHMAGFTPAGWFEETITLIPVNGVFQVDMVEQGAYHDAIRSESADRPRAG